MMIYIYLYDLYYLYESLKCPFVRIQLCHISKISGIVPPVALEFGKKIVENGKDKSADESGVGDSWLTAQRGYLNKYMRYTINQWTPDGTM